MNSFRNEIVQGIMKQSEINRINICVYVYIYTHISISIYIYNTHALKWNLKESSIYYIKYFQ